MTRLSGRAAPAHSGWRRVGTGTKYLMVMALLLPPLVLQQWSWGLAFLVVSAVLALSSGAGIRAALGIPLVLTSLLVVLGGYHVVTGNPELGVVVVTTVLNAVYASRVLTLTTPETELIDAVARFVRPLRRLGLNPDSIALTVAVMMRSIPLLLQSFPNVRQAAQARGQKGHSLRYLAPVVLNAVAHALATGDALIARGLLDEDSGRHHAA